MAMAPAIIVYLFTQRWVMAGVTQGAISQHLKSLKQAGLVIERPVGRNVYYRAQPEGLEPLVDWMSDYGAFWRDRLANLRNLLKEIDP